MKLFKKLFHKTRKSDARLSDKSLHTQITDYELYKEIQSGKVQANVTYKNIPLTYEMVKPVIHDIKTIQSGSAFYIGEENPLKPYIFIEEPYEDGVYQIHRLVVDEELRNKGYGKCVMYMYLTFAQIKKYKKITVINSCKNVPDFYSRFRWGDKRIEEIGREEN